MMSPWLPIDCTTDDDNDCYSLVSCHIAVHPLHLVRAGLAQGLAGGLADASELPLGL